MKDNFYADDLELSQSDTEPGVVYVFAHSYAHSADNDQEVTTKLSPSDVLRLVEWLRK